MKALIVEDEIAAQRNLIAVLAEVAPHITIVGTTDTVTDTVEWLRSNSKPDIIFMDIHLADGHSFHIFDAIEVTTPVIFTTAYDQYALEAFKLNSIEYLLKPIKANDLVHALNKLATLTNHELIRQLQQITNTATPVDSTKLFLIPFKSKLIPLSIDDICYFYTSNEHVHVTTLNGQTYPMDKSLDTIMGTLSSSDFYRANRQFIVVRKAIKDIDVWFGNRLSVNLVQKTPERVIISKNRVAEFKVWLGVIR
ncbi:LytTR family DNA-binding domain-containing protein [uncultured Acetobacteroides sp.]|uniref:LytR/AlgR family response regulator transcription factor n=1 Tax=uncultured Acetobacteroides sp. TaxID=1760811 RepID=UPI0029F5965B|nr:LytTR family DNA-binding domain-containing protein [uncultured Acetobacteroides sp.]